MFNFEKPENTEASSGFCDRQKNLFSVLESAEKDKDQKYGTRQSPSVSIEANDSNTLVKQKKINTRQFLGKESIFKKPAFQPPRHFRKPYVPDYQRNPHKWTKYSLEDVSADDMSDRCNSAAAFSFLQELAKRKTKEEIDSEAADLDKKIVFKKISKKETAASSSKPAVSFNRSKVVMPEYVIGLTKPAKNKRSTGAQNVEETKSNQKTMRLGHLEDEDDDSIKISSSVEKSKPSKQSIKLDHLDDEDVDE